MLTFSVSHAAMDGRSVALRATGADLSANATGVATYYVDGIPCEFTASYRHRRPSAGVIMKSRPLPMKRLPMADFLLVSRTCDHSLIRSMARRVLDDCVARCT
jgi:hypothetical protein